jgi:non-canonical (house-cleaning) NTP pyrophosphatase
MAAEGGGPTPALTPLRIALGTTNAAKKEAVELGFKAVLRRDLILYTCAVPSGVAPQPMEDEVTRRGALNRALAARDAWCTAHGDSSGPDFSLGVEGGCAKEYGELTCSAWVCVVPKGCKWEVKDGKVVENDGAPGVRTTPSFARSAVFAVPPKIAALVVDDGMELGKADDQVSGRSGSSHNVGTVGLVTQGAVTRATYYATAVTLALTPFLPGNEYLFPGNEGLSNK